MVTELSFGVQFGLKSYAQFQNHKYMVSDQNCTTRSLITTLYYIHFEIAQFNRPNTGF